MLPPQAGASRCCLDFLFHSAARGGPTSSLPPSPSRPAGWLSLVLLALVRCLYETAWNYFGHGFFIYLFFLTPASFIDSNTTFVKTTELNLSTFCAPATLAGITVKSFCTSSLEGHMRISPEKKQNYLLLPDKFPCDKGCSQFHQLGPNLLNSANFLSAKNLFRLQSERGNSRCPCWRQLKLRLLISTCEAAHSNSVTTSHSGAADEFLTCGFVGFFVFVLFYYIYPLSIMPENILLFFFVCFFKAPTESVLEGMC